MTSTAVDYVRPPSIMYTASVKPNTSYTFPVLLIFFFFNDTATTEIYTLSLHDALPISHARAQRDHHVGLGDELHRGLGDRKSTRLNSSHLVISYAVFCLKKKNHEILQCTLYQDVYNVGQPQSPAM